MNHAPILSFAFALGCTTDDDDTGGSRRIDDDEFRIFACACAAEYEDDEYIYEEEVAGEFCWERSTDLQEVVNDAAYECVSILESDGFYNVVCACACQETTETC